MGIEFIVAGIYYCFLAGLVAGALNFIGQIVAAFVGLFEPDSRDTSVSLDWTEKYQHQPSLSIRSRHTSSLAPIFRVNTPTREQIWQEESKRHWEMLCMGAQQKRFREISRQIQDRSRRR